jgi:prevent-host-death family protein
MERVIGATEARVHFGELMRQVTEKEQTVVVERDGKPQVVVLAVAAYERLRAAAGRASWEDALERAAEVSARIAARRGGQPLPAAAEMLRETREARHDQLDSALGLR